MRITLRAATLEDGPAVADVYLRSRKVFLAYAPLAHSDAEVRQWITDTLIPSGGVTVAVAGADLVGMVATSREEPISWIDHLYVFPDFVGQGIGTQLLDRAKQSLRPPIRLFTCQQNGGSRRFYERHGFRLIRFGDGRSNEENCPDALYEYASDP